MRPISPLFLLRALGALTVAVSGAAAAAAGDPSQWKCESCPYEKAATSGTVDLGVGSVSDDSARFGDYTGLDKQGAFVIAGGRVRYQGENGLFGSASASDLGLDSRSMAAELGQEGLFSLRLGYSEIPHWLTDSARTPFLGTGGSVLSLPAGFPVATTAEVPADSLNTVELGFKRSRVDAGATWFAGDHWTHKITARHDTREGTQKISGSFFSSAAHLVAPLNQETDQVELSTAYTSRKWQATLAYHASRFRNSDDSLTWANPFNPVVTGASTGQLALAPDNQFHQIIATGSYEILPQLRGSADLAFGRMTQDSAFLAPTQNATLLATLPALPASSLDGRVDTFNGNARLSYEATDRLRINASYVRNVHDNRTQSLAYPALSTDMFLGSAPRTNQPFTIKQDRYKINADYRYSSTLKASVGADEDDRRRTLQDTGTTREGTVWGRIAVQLRDWVSLAAKLSHADRRNSGYASPAWVSPTENVYMRKYNLADRWRDSVGLRADITPLDGLAIGVHLDISNDDYRHSSVGLTDARSTGFGADVSASLSETTQVRAFAESERLRSNQAGSSSAALPDWWAKNEDAVDLIGVGIKQMLLGGKLDLGADYTYSRSQSDVTVNAGPGDPGFPTAKTSVDSIKIYAVYRLQDNLSLNGGFWYENYRSNDWSLDGVQATTVANLLAFGNEAPRYHVTVLRMGVSYRF